MPEKYDSLSQVDLNSRKAASESSVVCRSSCLQKDLKMTSKTIFSAAIIASFVMGAAQATVAQTTLGDSDAEIAIDAIEEAIDDSYERDVPAFGNEGRPLGFSGEVAARAAAATGNSDTVDAGLGARLGFFDGKNGHRLTMSWNYSEADGVTDEDSALLAYDYTRELGARIYGFGKMQAAYNSVLEDGGFEDDVFLGFGAGYRVISTRDAEWSVQAGPGYRVASIEGVVEDLDEAAISFGSYYERDLSDTLSLTNDTDVLWSDSDTAVVNILALNTDVSDKLSLRTSITTKYNSDPQGTAKNTDNLFGLSLVYRLN